VLHSPRLVLVWGLFIHRLPTADFGDFARAITSSCVERGVHAALTLPVSISLWYQTIASSCPYLVEMSLLLLTICLIGKVAARR